MNRFFKFIEIIFFIFINLLFSSFALAVWCVFEVGFFVAGIAMETYNSLDYAEDAGFGMAFFLWLIYVTAKLILFPILYKAEKKFPWVHEFFDLFYCKKIISISILVLALFIPVVEYIIFFSDSEFLNVMLGQLFTGYGVLFSYLIMYFYLRCKNMQK